MAALVSWLPNLLRRRRRDALLAAAAGWPIVGAKLLKSVVVARDPLAEDGTAFQEQQVESGFYFTLPAGYFGGHLRTVPLSDSEAHRLLRQLPEDLAVAVRYNPEIPTRPSRCPPTTPTSPPHSGL